MSTAGISSLKQAIRWSGITVAHQSEIVTQIKKIHENFRQ